MPTYVYRCDDCGLVFERFESITSEPVRVCPDCASLAHRVITAGAGLIFKGSGFYVTDYKRQNSVSSAAKKNGSEKSEPDRAGENS